MTMLIVCNATGAVACFRFIHADVSFFLFLEVVLKVIFGVVSLFPGHAMHHPATA